MLSSSACSERESENRLVESRAEVGATEASDMDMQCRRFEVIHFLLMN